mmetsp:Transcript_148020/g.475278  ORF Transcript_148020/g.475278 Transcript_148020/m.475278 type:complete len:203 (-) Transcript_148020:111-719(-)
MFAGSPGGSKIMPRGRGVDSKKTSGYARSMQSEDWESGSCPARRWTTDNAKVKSTCCPRRSTMGKYLGSKPCGSALPQCKMLLTKPWTCASKALIFFALWSNFHVLPSRAANTLAALDGSVKLTKANPTLQSDFMSHGTETKLIVSLGTRICISSSTSETVYFRGRLRNMREVTCSLSQASSACARAAQASTGQFDAGGCFA